MPTIIEKLWDSHVVHEQPGAPRCSSSTCTWFMYMKLPRRRRFQGLRERGLKVRRPDLTIATVDHSIPTTDRSLPILDAIAAKQLAQLDTNCREFGIRCSESTATAGHCARHRTRNWASRSRA
jgi:3-isopropylmalate/(R)-2-methylmalate dehydratase large subunit